MPPSPHDPDCAAPAAWVVVDLETTGGSPAAGAHVIELGAALVARGRVLQTVGTLVRPPRYLDLKTTQAMYARRVHRIDDDVVWRDGLPTAQAASRLRTWLCRVRDRHGTVGVTSYNLPFERRFLDPSPWALGDLDGVTYAPCLLALARAALPELPSHRLSEVAAHLDLRAAESHRAVADADLAARVWLALGFPDRTAR